MNRQPPPPPGGPFGPVGTYPTEPPPAHVHDLAKPAYHASTYEFGSSPDADSVLAATPVPKSPPVTLRISLVGFVAAILVAAAGFVSWTAGRLADDPAAKPSDRALRWLWDVKALPTESPKLVVVLGIAAGLIVLGALIGAARWLMALGGVVAVLVAGLHIKQLNALNLADTNVFTLVGAGTWLCVGGGLVAVGAAVLSGRRH